MNLKKGTFYILLANLFHLLVSLFTGFVVPKFLSIETYADVKLFQLYLTYIGVATLGFGDGMYLEHGGKSLEELDQKEISNEFKTFKRFQFTITLIVMGISILVKNKILFFCSLVILPVNIGGYLRNFYSAIGQFKKYSRFTNINTFLIFLINIFLLFIIKTDNANIYIIGYIIAYLIYWIIIEKENKSLFQYIGAKSSKKYVQKYVQGGFSLMIGNFCNIIFTSIDRLFVQYLLGTIKFAFYSFAVSIENVISTFITPISTTMYNYFCKQKEKEKIIEIKKIILFFASGVIVLIFPAKFITNIWLSKYNEAMSILFLLVAAQYISILVRCVHINIYKALKKQNQYFKRMMFIVLLSILLNIAFYICYQDMISIAIATLITNIVWFVVGEIDLKTYHFEAKEYVYIFLNLLILLFCGSLDNALIGMVIYIISVILSSYILLKDSLLYCMKEAKELVKKITKKFT